MKKLEIPEKGAKFNQLEFTGNTKHLKEGRWLGEFLCTCGNLCYARFDLVKEGTNKTCGHNSRSFGYKKMWKEYGEDYKYRVLHKRASSRAKKNKIPFELTYLDIKELYLKQNGKCIYTNLSIRMPDNFVVIYEPDIASLDRIDSTKSYTKDNVQLVHKMVNMVKNTLSHIEFITLCKLVTENNPMKDEDYCSINLLSQVGYSSVN